MRDWPVSKRPGSIDVGMPVTHRGAGGSHHALVSLTHEPGVRGSLCDQIALWSMELGLYSQGQRKRRRARRAATGGTP